MISFLFNYFMCLLIFKCFKFNLDICVKNIYPNWKLKSLAKNFGSDSKTLTWKDTLCFFVLLSLKLTVRKIERIIMLIYECINYKYKTRKFIFDDYYYYYHFIYSYCSFALIFFNSHLFIWLVWKHVFHRNVTFLQLVQTEWCCTIIVFLRRKSKFCESDEYTWF